MIDLLGAAPIAAAGFAVPQFLPQIRKLLTTRDTAGVSPSWAALTSVNNAAWLAYFIMSRYWTALIPSTSATLLAGTLAVLLLRRLRPGPRPAALIAAWAITLAAAGVAAGRVGLGTLLTAAFLLQVTPSLWTAYRTPRPTGRRGSACSRSWARRSASSWPTGCSYCWCGGCRPTSSPPGAGGSRSWPARCWSSSG